MSIITSRSGITCLVPAPRRTSKWMLPFEPFQTSLWIVLAVILIIETMELLVMYKVGESIVTKCSWSESFEYSCFLTIILCLSQSAYYNITSISIRIVLFTFFIVDIIITCAYSAGLSSTLTIPSYEEAADTVERLIKHRLVWAGTSPDWTFSLQNINEDKMFQIVDLFRCYNAEELQQKSLTGEIGIVLERLQFENFAIPNYIHKEAIQHMKVMIEDISYEYCVAYTPRLWSLLDLFNQFVLLIQSSGILKIWEWKVIAKHLDSKIQRQLLASAKSDKSNHDPVQLIFSNFVGTCVVWIIGIFLSIFIFMGELYLNWMTDI